MLQPGGLVICALHNPAVRRQVIDGQIHVLGEYPLPDGTGVLRLSNREQIKPDQSTVTGEQIYEDRDQNSHPLQQIDLPLRVILHKSPDFCRMVESAGFRLLSIIGNFDNCVFGPPTGSNIIVRFKCAPV